LDQTDDYTIQPSDLGAWITLSFSSEYTLTAGTTFRIALGSYLNPLDTVGINTSGVGNYSSQGLYDKDGIYSDPVGTPNWYTISGIPMLRMNFDPGSVSAVSDVKQEEKGKLIKIVDVLGRKTEKTKNSPLFYMYENGIIEKQLIVE
ncbi:MAG: hypothetical protein H8D33_02535, partial [Cryomorphaceae bacterium]|nr:hypothetical protein [Cryomorphaceae bacterium]